MTAGGDSVFFIDYTGRIAESANTAIKKQCGGGLAGDEPCVVVKNGPKETSQHQSRVEYGLHKIRSYLWLVPLIHTEFWISAGFALIQPFFPEVLKTQSPTLCYLIGQGGFFLFLIVFGCLYWIQNGEALLATSIAAVIFGGLANNMYLVGMFTVVTTKFEDNSGIFILEGSIIPSVSSEISGGLVRFWKTERTHLYWQALKSSFP
ncbi:hypothetical protein V5799_012431 [Amblyomma americanum]|uniref:Uncharacterized protein n=1 Tax=Amblyomma americanum TaxID=6943 RepID=A0AAQ4EEE3_AMBAM